MDDIVIRCSDFTKDYGNHRGVFNANLEIKKGECYGFIGINGAGKTTTIRNFMGFIQPTSGHSTILGYDCWKDRTVIKNYVSYIPGEIAFPNLSTGTEFLKIQAEYLNVTDYTYMNKLIKQLQLDPTANLKRMSKGMKQKTAIVAALMGDKEILIMDEPTTGLDPLMRDQFIELVLEEKKKGKTIFMSSHIFEEIESVCDRASIIKNGDIIDTVDINQLKSGNIKSFVISFLNHDDLIKFSSEHPDKVTITDEKKNQCEALVYIEDINGFLNDLTEFSLLSMKEHHMTLEEYFSNVYREVK